MLRESLVYKKAFQFALDIIKVNKFLCENKKEYVLSKQLLRSGTSIGANIKEALYAQSRLDFISKMNIALKETSESEYWLDLLKQSSYMSEELIKPIMKQCIELNKMLSSIVKTTKESLAINKK